MTVNRIPPGYEGATPYLIIKDALAAIEYYEKAFGARPTMCLKTPDGGVAHAEIRIGAATVMLTEENATMGMQGPQTLGGTAVSMLLYFDDVDAQVEQAIAAGGTVIRPLEDQFWGDRMGTIKDPFGHVWSLATHVEDVPPDEMDRRFAAMMEKGGH